MASSLPQFSVPPMAPYTKAAWARMGASSRGGGSLRECNWSIVVMNADGSRGVDAQVSAAADLPILSWIAWSTLGVGIILVAGGAALIVAGTRPRRPGAAPVAVPV